MTCEVIDAAIVRPYRGVPHRNFPEHTMPDPKSVALQYLHAWNETDPDRRARVLRDGWTEDARYVDPLMHARGVQEIDGLIAGVHARWVPASASAADSPRRARALSWSLGPATPSPPIEGGDVIEPQRGRIA
jgi:hypothetical protein